MKQRACLFVLALVMMMAPSTLLAQSARILCSSDRPASTTLDVWKMREDGSQPTQMTSEPGAAQRPSICLDGRKIFYDVGGDLFVMDGGGSNQLNLGCGVAGQSCEDADCGSPVNSRPRILYTLEQDQLGPNLYNIFMATYDPVLETLVDIVQLTNTGQQGKNEHPAWCGDDQVVWSRTQEFVPYQYEICTMPVSGGTPTCRPTGGTNNRHPSCKSDGSEIAWAREVVGYTVHEICKMDFDGSNVKCLTDDNDPLHNFDDTRPVWSPSGTQIGFASDRQDALYDIWAVNSDLEGPALNLTPFSTSTDDEPDWGGAVLGP